MSADRPDRTVALVDASALLANVAALRRRLPSRTRVAAVLKANAYGHGLEPVARVLAGEVDSIAVAEAADAATLAAARTGAEVLLLGPAEAGAQADLARQGVAVTIDSAERLRALLAAAPPAGTRAHLLVDTGLRRLGVPGRQVPEVLELGLRAGLRWEGAFLHPARADDGDWASVAAEVDKLTAALGGHRVALRHHGGTSVAVERPDLAGNLARLGIGLFGHHPHPRQRELVTLEPVLRLVAPVVAVVEVPAGTRAGYGDGVAFPRPARLATLGVGVAHGLLPCLTRGGVVALRGREAPFTGPPSLEYAQVDVSEIPGVRTGDPATVLGGRAGEPTSLAAVAARGGMVADHVVAGISPRVPRRTINEREGSG